MSDTTIYALATPPGRGAIAVIRISGPDAGRALSRFTRPAPRPRVASLRALSDPITGELLDRALVLWFPAPGSYTGEDQAELQLHGGPAVITTVMAALAGLGLRLARPGEFTRRAFENGKMDLLEAEAIADLVDAESREQQRQALSQLAGALSGRQAEWRTALLESAALVEAEIDFPDDDLPSGLLMRARAHLARLAQEISLALDDARGEVVRDGYRIAIIGPPNAGKSSLLNALCGRDAAIVTAVPGTTRDIIEVAVDIQGFRVILADTAGLRETIDPVEVEGVRRARLWGSNAQLRLLVVDRNGSTGAWRDAAHACRRSDILVLNKADLPAAADAATAREWASEHGMEMIDCRSRAGDTEALKCRLADRVIQELSGSDFPTTTRQRHRAVLTAALGFIEEAAVAKSAELVGEGVRLASRALKSLSGDIDTEQILDQVFASFCIGK